MLAAEFPSGVQVVAANQVWEIVISGTHWDSDRKSHGHGHNHSYTQTREKVRCRLPFLLLIENINIDQNSQWLRPLSNFLVIHFEHVFLPAI